jgi:hypothetical protein
MSVPPLPGRLSICLLKENKFCGVTHFRPQSLWAQFSNVMIESLSEGVRVSMRYFMVFLTSSIFYPHIDPLTSMTQIKSTLVLEPPQVLRETIAGRMVSCLSLAIDLWALISISIVTSFLFSMSLLTSASSSLKRFGCLGLILSLKELLLEVGGIRPKRLSKVLFLNY